MKKVKAFRFAEFSWKNSGLFVVYGDKGGGGGGGGGGGEGGGWCLLSSEIREKSLLVAGLLAGRYQDWTSGQQISPALKLYNYFGQPGRQ